MPKENMSSRVWHFHFLPGVINRSSFLEQKGVGKDAQI